MICHVYAIPEPVGRLLAELAHCCLGAVEGGPGSCTCWEPEYDLDQAPIRPGQPTARTKMCDDCAFRPDSPERTGDDRYTHVGEDLAALPNFHCHQGLRRPVRWRHPLGIVIEADTDGYAPPIRDGVPYKADGTPADMCAGWAAHQLAAVETA